MVQLKIIEKIPDKFSIDGGKETYKAILYVKDISPQMLNAIKRAAEEYAKTLAIETVNIYENSSALWDEFIAHRLGLIPIKTPEDIDSRFKITGRLKKSGPGYVFSKDIEFENGIKPAYEDIPIVYLEKDQSIDISFEAEVGDGRTHAKWIPGYVYYYKLADIKLKEKPTKEELKLLEELGVKIKNNKIVLPDDKKYDRTFIDSIESILKDKVEIAPKDEYILIIESFGNYSPKRILKESIKELKGRLIKMLDFLMK